MRHYSIFPTQEITQFDVTWREARDTIAEVLMDLRDPR